MKQFPNGSRYDLNKPVRILLTGMLCGESGTLTGNYEVHDICGEERMMLEVDHAFGKDFIFEESLSQ